MNRAVPFNRQIRVAGLQLQLKPNVSIKTGNGTGADINLSIHAKSVFELLYGLNQEATQSRSRDQFLKRVLEVSIQILQANSGSLVLFDDKGNACEAILAYKDEVRICPVEQLVDILQRGLAGWVFQHRRPVLVGNTRTDKRWLRRAWEENTTSRSAISAPLINGEDVLGVLTLVHSEPERFGEKDLSLLSAIAVQISSQSGSILSQLDEINHR
jgi:sigma-B regulation protein RsbU (phosphoserine phosphatase)